MSAHLLIGSALAALTFFLSPSLVLSQRQYWNWHFGEHAAITFSNGGTPTALPNSALASISGSTSISDRTTGDLLFYATMSLIWDRTNRTMLFGDSSRGCRVWGMCAITHQSVLALKQPGAADRFVLVSVEEDNPFDWDTMTYTVTEIDMRLNSGLGAVTSRSRLIWPFGAAQLTAVRMCGRDGYWIIGHEPRGNRFIVIPLDSAGVGQVRTQNVGEEFRYELGTYGYLKATIDGRRLAIAGGNDEPHVQIIDFDRARGRLADTPAIRIWMGPGFAGAYGVSFSPTGRFLYVTRLGGGLFRFDLSTNDSLTVAQSRREISNNERLRALQLGPDGRIYAVSWGEQNLAVVRDPENAADAGFGSGPDLGSYRSPYYEITNVVEGELGVRFITSQRDTVCLGDTLRLSARWVASPQWSPGDGLSCAACPDPLASPRTTTTYYLFDRASSACGPVDSITITVPPLPRFSVAGDSLLCPGDSTVLNVIGGTRVVWQASEDLSCSECRSVTIRPRATTMYYFDVENNEGCRIRDSILLRVTPSPAPDLGRDVELCTGDSARLRAEGGVSYRWTPATGLSCDTCAEVSAAPAVSTTYRVTVTSAAGCTGHDDIRVVVLPAAVVDAGADTSICLGQDVALTASGALAYRWNDSPDLSCVDCPTALARPQATTTYVVTGTNEFGCIARDSVTVTVRQPPALVIEGDSVICAGGSARLSARGGDRYSWWTSAGPLSCTTCSEQVVHPESTTTYYVRGDVWGCSIVDSFTVIVARRLELTVTGGGEICRAAGVRLKASDASTYRWEPAEGLSCTDCQEPIAAPLRSTTYRVIGTLTGGCADTAFVDVVVIEPRTINATIERGVRLLPGQNQTLHITLDQVVVSDSIAFEIRWNNRVAQIGSARPTSLLSAAGWIIESPSVDVGSISGVLRRSVAASVGPGAILEFEVAAFIGDSIATELPLAMRASAAACADVEGRPGQVLLDSICGLSFRLIEASDALLKLDPPIPNPVAQQMVVMLSTPFDGPVELSIVDARGESQTLLNEYMTKGSHALRFDASVLKSGLYTLRLRTGSGEQTRVFIVSR